jgi:NADH:ubiquinone oxidoreductase subunit E
MDNNKSSEVIGQLAVDPVFLDSVLERNGFNPEALIMIMQDITAEYNYLPEEALTYVARKLEIPPSQIFGAATFYKAFSLTPRGKHIVNVCVGTACHVRGAEKIMETIGDKLEIKQGETTPDLGFTLESVRCLGCCALGPVITVNEKAHGGLNRSKALKVIEQYEKEV